MATAPSTVSDPELEGEQAYLHYAYDCLELMRERLETMAQAGGDMKAAAALRKLSEETASEYAETEQAGLCFGRIDLEAGDTHYIGRASIHDASNDQVIISWRAPAAAPFYTATPEEPLGLERRRKFRAEGRALLGYADELFGALLKERGPLGVLPADDYLLAELEKARSSEMRDIASTIQREQYRLITQPARGILVVQGAPGTGKTAVALHRAAWLLFDSEPLRRQGLLVVGPNRAFMQYVSQVLPALGENAVDQSDIDHLVAGARASSDDPVAVQQIKADVRVASVIALALEQRIRPPDSDLEATFNGRSFQISAVSVSELVSTARATGRAHVDARQRFVEQLADLWFASYAASTGSRAQLRVSNETKREIQRGRDFQNALDRIWPTLSAKQLLQDLFTSETRLAAATEGLLDGEEQRRLLRPPGRLEDAVWTISDLPLLDEAEALLRGPSETFGHVVVDEAQDLTPMQLRMIARRSATGSMTVVGDIAQGTGVWPHESWVEVLHHLPDGDSATVEELTLGYRVPKQIMDFALPILEITAPDTEPPRAFRPGRAGPALVRVGTDELLERLVEEVMALTETPGTAGIIVPAGLLPDVRAALAGAYVEYGEALRDPLGPQLELLTPRAAKGLEFDEVVVVEPALIVEESPITGLRELYVALTRATQHMTVLHSMDLPHPLPRTAPAPEVPDSGFEQDSRAATVSPLAAVSESPEVLSESPEVLSARLTEAFTFARLLHATQVRKGSETPYVAQLLGVAALVIEDGGTEDEAIAALLHDAAEDQGGAPTLAMIERQFGRDVAEIVAGCSDTLVSPKPPWRARKEAYVAKLARETDPRILRVSLADKVYNARTMVSDFRRIGTALWERFDPSSDQLWYYRSLLDGYRRAGVSSPMLHELESRVLELERMVAEA